ncbi:sigma-54-dependent transcriptional regulator [Minwuia thermotolerans]|uniref:DNA-binding transcriptional regulator NtrC n=1 Tax=Minwuia thermotolerans TaxID=2056226 RepID=A0A2M9FYJ3_9PROT|nr:sigma-54 dependent transcriptional regulator [Minwuia thermotolerans]PJK28531.1 sigma-54-dependent Fis family transcriptional regulator [Minwuia thermotolerans]
MAKTVLIVDDDPTQLRLLESVVAKAEFRVEKATGGAEALKRLTQGRRGDIDVVLLDLAMPEIDGLEVLERVRPQHPDLPVVVLTAHGGVDTVVKAMRAGASDFLVKPASPERIRVTLENSLKLKTLTGEISRLTRKISGELGFDDLVARSPAMTSVIDLSKRAAASTIPILIEGESGVGKELVARAIQGSSERARRPFVTVNCGAIPENLVESVLFGHEKGAFTGATHRNMGKFQEASGGTLFLDEIGELKLDMQVKLLRALQQGEVDPVGAASPVKVDIRLISATNRDLAEMVREGGFREDLYYRLNVYPILIPPLRDRVGDIPLLVEHFTRTFAASENKPIRGVAPEAMELLESHDWPGNVRQLENTIFRAIVLAESEMLTLDDFPQLTGAGHRPRRTADAEIGITFAERPDCVGLLDAQGHARPLAEVELDIIRNAIDRYGGQMSEVARRLEIGRSTLYRKLREIEAADHDQAAD